MEAQLFIPRHVKEFAESYKETPGAVVTLEKRGDRRWYLSATNSRVHMEYELRVYGKVGKLSPTLHVLTVDGKQAERWPGDTFKALLEFFRDPETVATKTLDPMPPERPLQEAPQKIQNVYNKLAKGAKEKPELHVRLGSANGCWVVGVDSDRFSLRANFRFSKGRWQYDRKGLQLLVDGIDCSQSTRGDIEKAMDYLTGKLNPERPAMTSAIHGESSGKRSNATEVRKATVIRT